MLPEYLKKAGYATGVFGKWHLGHWPKEIPNDRGFDEFFGFLKGAHPYALLPDDKKFKHNKKQYCEKAHATDYITKKALNFIKDSNKKKKPFLTYVAYNAVHGPLWQKNKKKPSAPRKWLSAAEKRGIDFPRRDYVATLEHMDHCIGELLKLLKELKIEENTMVIFASDNGAITMNIKDAAMSKYPGNNGPLRGGKGMTYEGGIRVPCVMAWKGKFPANIISDETVANIDIFPTILEAVGLAAPKMNGKNPVRGTSLIPHIISKAKKKMPNRTLFFELTGKVGMRKGRWKLVGNVDETRGVYANTASQLKNADLELYDLGSDIGETKDLKAKMPERYNELKKEIIGYFKSINCEFPGAGKVKTSSKKDKSLMSREERQKLRDARLLKKKNKKK